MHTRVYGGASFSFFSSAASAGAVKARQRMMNARTERGVGISNGATRAGAGAGGTYTEHRVVLRVSFAEKSRTCASISGGFSETSAPEYGKCSGASG